MESKVLAEPVLVGREKELDLLHRFLELASEGQGKTVFISAEAGVGKTRLLQEFLSSEKRNKNTVILSGWCLFNAGVPYFPIIEAFSNYYTALGEKGEEEETTLNSWLKSPAKAELSGKLQFLPPQALKDQTFAAVAKTIHSIASQNQVILAIEDIHWADSASLALLHYIARAVKGSERVLVLATFRSEELTHDAEGYPHQLVETLAMMRREDLFHQINLPNLDPACVTKMAESMLGGTLHEALAEKLAVTSEGNPLFVMESLRMLHEQRKLDQKNDGWHLAVEEIEIPNKIRDIITQRVTCLKNAERRTLDAASVIGDEFEVGLLSAVIEQDSLDILETLNVVAHSTSLICVDEDRFRFDHARSREVIYEAIAKPLRQGYHSRIAEKLEGSKSSTPPLRDLAYHYAQAGNTEKALKYALAAGQNELVEWSNAQAIEHFTYVLQIVGQDPERVKEKASALEGLGDAFFASSMFKESMRVFEELSQTAETGIVKLRAFRKAMESAFLQGDILHMLELVKKAEPCAAADRLEYARVLGCRGRAFMFLNKPGYIKDLEAALQVFEQEYSLWDVARTLIDVGHFHSLNGKDHEGLAEALRSIALLDELGDFRSRLWAYFIAGHDFTNCLLYDKALDVYAKIISLNENMKMGDYNNACYANSWSGILISLFLGDLEKGLSYNLRARELSKKTDSLVTQGTAYSNLTKTYVLLGDIDHAEENFKKLLKLPHDIFNFGYVNGELTRAILSAGKGQWNVFEELFERLKASHVAGRLQVVEWYYAWVLERQGRLDEARIQRAKMKENLREAEERFEHANVQANLMVRRRVVVGEELEMRVDLVNVGRKPCTVFKITGAVPPEFNAVGSLQSFCNLQNGDLFLSEKVVEPFKVETIKLKLKATKSGNFRVFAEAIFIDDLGETKTSKPKSITITAKPLSSKTKIASIPKLRAGKFEFKSEKTKKAFNYLTTAFEKDFLNRRFSEEKSGWRTLTEISRNAQISMYSMYGRHGRGGEVTKELRLLDVVESRLLFGERGRGGHVLKIRIRYEKLKQLVDEQRSDK